MIVQNSFPIKTEFSPVQDTTPFAGVLPFMKILADRKILLLIALEKYSTIAVE